jgi:hypothetical protein
MRRHSFGLPVALVVIVPSLLLVACGGPSAPSEEGIVLQGAVVGGGTASASSGTGTGFTAAAVVVTVLENSAITTTVGADGTFSLRGLPPGGFTLVFTSGGVQLGAIPFADVKANQEITITVRIDGTAVTVLEERRNGIGHGDLEIEGRVEAVMVLDPSADSVFVIDGHTVVARPGQTAIREGNRSRSVNDVAVGRQVHVKGVFMPSADRGSQRVLAEEIKLQGSETGGNPAPSACTAGANAEVEGPISSKGAGSIVVRQQSKGDFLCLVSAGTRIRKGNTTYTLEQLQNGWRVHVKGTQAGMSGSACQVNASEIMVQQN